jgi:hypothetical protein
MALIDDGEWHAVPVEDPHGRPDDVPPRAAT